MSMFLVQCLMLRAMFLVGPTAKASEWNYIGSWAMRECTPCDPHVAHCTQANKVMCPILVLDKDNPLKNAHLWAHPHWPELGNMPLLERPKIVRQYQYHAINVDFIHKLMPMLSHHHGWWAMFGWHKWMKGLFFSLHGHSISLFGNQSRDIFPKVFLVAQFFVISQNQNSYWSLRYRTKFHSVFFVFSISVSSNLRDIACITTLKPVICSQ